MSIKGGLAPFYSLRKEGQDILFSQGAVDSGPLFLPIGNLPTEEGQMPADFPVSPKRNLAFLVALRGKM